MKKTLLSVAALVGLGFALAQAEVTIGKPAPAFTLPSQDGTPTSLSTYKGKYVVLEWFNPGCPFVKKHYESGNMQKLQETYTRKGVVWLSINSSAQGKEGYTTAKEASDIRLKWKSPSTALLLDPEGKVAKLYSAKTTPDMFIIDPQGNLIYQGAIDDKAATDPADIATSKNYVAAALDAALAGKPVAEPFTKSYGCSVKYQ